MEIERKFLIKELPDSLSQYESKKIEQAYLCTKPVVRIRKENDSYYLTYKGSGMMSREEYNLPLDSESYSHLLSKADGNIITKTRYFIPYETYTIELDVFEGIFKGMILAEVEFDSEDEANSFTPPWWFGEDVTFSGKYHNSYLSTWSASSRKDSPTWRLV